LMPQRTNVESAHKDALRAFVAKIQCALLL
jgi:hypothetical protein